MKVSDAWHAPWRANLPGTRWLTVALMLLAASGAIIWGVYADKATWWAGSVGITDAFEAMLWAFVLSNMVLLAIDARQLRLPGVQHSLVAGAALYGLLSVGLPALVFGLIAGHAVVVAVFMALCCLGGLVYALLPRYAGILFYASFYFVMRASSVPGLGKAGFLGWAIPSVLLLLLVAVVRARQLLVASKPCAPGRNAPPVLMLGRGIGGAFAAGAGRYGSRAIAARPSWMQAKASLRGCGSGHTVASLRLALGGMFMPTSLMGWLRKRMVMLAAVFAFCGFMVWQALGRSHAQSPITDRHTSQLLLLSMLAGFASASMAFNCVIELSQRWRKPNAELQLLALLPGLRSGSADVIRDLLRAILLPPLRIQLWLLVMLLALTVGLHAQTSTQLYVLASQLSAALAVVAYTLLTIGGQEAGRWANLGIGLLWTLLLMLPLFVSGRESHLGSQAMTSLTVLFDAGWMFLVAVLLWLGRRGWRGLLQRPHPFLPNGFAEGGKP